MPTIDEKQEALDRKKALMQQVVNLRDGEHLRWKVVTARAGLNTHQWALQLYKQAKASGMTAQQVQA